MRGPGWAAHSCCQLKMVMKSKRTDLVVDVCHPVFPNNHTIMGRTIHRWRYTDSRHKSWESGIDYRGVGLVLYENLLEKIVESDSPP